MKYIVFIIVLLCYINIGDSSVAINKQITLQPSFSDKIKAIFLQSNEVSKKSWFEKSWYKKDMAALGDASDAVGLIKELSKVDPAIQIKYFLMSFLTNDEHEIEKDRLNYNRRAISRLMLFALSGLLTSRNYGVEGDTSYNNIQGLLADRFKQHGHCLVDDKGNLNTDNSDNYRKDGSKQGEKVIDESINANHFRTYSWDLFVQDLVEDEKSAGTLIDNTLQCIALCSLKKDTFDKLITETSWFGKIKKHFKDESNCFDKPVCCKGNDLITVNNVQICKTQALAAKQVRANMNELYNTYNNAKKFPHQINTDFTDETFDIYNKSSVVKKINNVLRNHERSPCNSIQEMFRFFKTWEGAKNEIDEDRLKAVKLATNIIKKVLIVFAAVLSAAIVTALTIGASVASYGAASVALPFILPVVTLIGTTVAAGVLNLAELGINHVITRQFEKRTEKRNERISLQTLGMSLLEGNPFDANDNAQLRTNYADTSLGSIEQANRKAKKTRQQINEEFTNEQKEMKAKQVALRFKLIFNRYYRKLDKYTLLKLEDKIVSLKKDHKKALKTALKYSSAKLKLTLKKKKTDTKVLEILKHVGGLLSEGENECGHRLDNTFKFFKWMFEDPEKWKTNHGEYFKKFDELGRQMEGKDWGEVMRNSIGLKATRTLMGKVQSQADGVTTWANGYLAREISETSEATPCNCGEDNSVTTPSPSP